MTPTTPQQREQMDVTDLLIEVLRIILEKVNIPKESADEVKALMAVAQRKAKEDNGQP